MNIPFTPGATSTLAVSNVTGSVALTGTGPSVEIQNTGATLMFVKLGSSTVTAALTDYPVQACHSKVVTRDTGSTHIAAITAASTTTLYATVGGGS